MLMGGGERFGNQLIWSEFARLAGGTGKSVALFPTAADDPEYGDLIADHLRKLGLDPFVVPVSPVLATPLVADVVRDPTWIEKVRSCNAIFLLGGSQSRYRDALMDTEGRDTPMLKAIRDVYRRGGLVAGSSAGTAVMSRIMFVDANSPIAVLRDGAKMGERVDLGFGFLPEKWFVDQHFLARGRLARTLVAMQTYDFPFGIGVDEDTALILEAESKAKVVGYRSVVIIDGTHAERKPEESRFHWNNVRLSFLTHGDSFDLLSRTVSVGPHKLDQFKVDPNGAGFEPSSHRRQYYLDIFGKSALHELMYELVDSSQSETVGLCFDGQAARNGSTLGFEIRFRKIKDSVGWESLTGPGDPYTVLNIGLDVRPVEIQGLFYR